MTQKLYKSVKISQSYSQKYNVTFFYGSLCICLRDIHAAGPYIVMVKCWFSVCLERPPTVSRDSLFFDWQRRGSGLERRNGQVEDAGKVRELQRELVHQVSAEVLNILQAKTPVRALQVLRVQKLLRVRQRRQGVRLQPLRPAAVGGGLLQLWCFSFSFSYSYFFSVTVTVILLTYP